MRLVSVSILVTHNQTNYKCLFTFVQTDNASAKTAIDSNFPKMVNSAPGKISLLLQTRADLYHFLCFKRKKGREGKKWKRLQMAGSPTFGHWLLIWHLTLFSSPRPSEFYVFPVFKDSNVKVETLRSGTWPTEH